ncbi:MAG: hypothetical protein GY754_08870 [bacterium]|nr:hypothetical protein [bacterium]
MFRKIITVTAALVISISLLGCFDSSEAITVEESIETIEVSPWPQGKVYYQLDSAFEEENDNDRITLKAISRAMGEWSEVANIEFINCADDGVNCGETFVYNIYKSDRNASTIGYSRDARLYIDPPTTVRSAVHEIGHCLGFSHEHQRYDRDEYITVNWENLISAAYSQYILVNNTLINEENYDYDYRSVMHYAVSAGTKEWGMKAYTINDPDYDDQWPTYLTDTDIQKALDIYGEIAQ